MRRRERRHSPVPLYNDDNWQTELKCGHLPPPTASSHGFFAETYPFPVCTSCVWHLTEHHAEIRCRELDFGPSGIHEISINERSIVRTRTFGDQRPMTPPSEKPKTAHPRACHVLRALAVRTFQVPRNGIAS